MRYGAIVTKEGKSTLAEFPDCPGCQTFAGPGEDISAQARDALVGWLEATLQTGEVPPAPRSQHRGEVLWVDVPSKLAVMIELKRARVDAGLSQAELAARAGVSQPAIAKLENPDANPTVETLEKVASALGASLDISLTLPPPRTIKRYDRVTSSDSHVHKVPRSPTKHLGGVLVQKPGPRYAAATRVVGRRSRGKR